MTGHELLRREADGSLVRHADLSGLSRSPHGWNEIVVDGRGNIYVNSVGFNFGEEAFRPGIIALVTPDGGRQVADDIAFPNGMVVTPDNKTLIVAESFAASSPRSTSPPTAACRTGACGPNSAGRAAATASAWTRRARSGPRCCARTGRSCWRPRGREVLERIELEHACFACMLGARMAGRCS